MGHGKKEHSFSLPISLLCALPHSHKSSLVFWVSFQLSLHILGLLLVYMDKRYVK